MTGCSIHHLGVVGQSNPQIISKDEKTSSANWISSFRIRITDSRKSYQITTIDGALTSNENVFITNTVVAQQRKPNFNKTDLQYRIIHS